AEMRVAMAAQDLRAGHVVAAVDGPLHVLFVGRRRETWPSRPRFEFVVGIEEGSATADTLIRTLCLVIPVTAGEGALGPLLARDMVLFRSEPLAILGGLGVISGRTSAGRFGHDRCPPDRAGVRGSEEDDGAGAGDPGDEQSHAGAHESPPPR